MKVISLLSVGLLALAVFIFGPVATPASAAIFFEVILSPIALMALGGGPIKTSPSLLNAWQKLAFSLRKP